jgi:hypothetical protein
VLAGLPIGEGVDAVKADKGLSFASCRDGKLLVFSEASPGRFEMVQTVRTPLGARTMGLDSSTGIIYLPTAEFAATQSTTARPAAKPGTFMVVVVSDHLRK